MLYVSVLPSEHLLRRALLIYSGCIRERMSENSYW